MKQYQSSLGLGALVLIFFGLIIVNNVLFDKARLDLTENNIYSISDGSQGIIEKLDEPVNLYFFFSERTSEGITHIRNYAKRVQSLLEEYALYSDGKIKLHIIDPEPFSEAEDRAAAFGLTSATANAAGDSLYFGLGATNSLDAKLIIPFFDPSKEEFLEYDISQLIYKLSDPTKVKVALISSLPYAGDDTGNPMMRNPNAAPAWVFYDQLKELYDIVDVAVDATELPADIDVIMLAHPQGLSDELKFAIDQYVMAGGSVFGFVDPHAEIASAGIRQGRVGRNSSEMDELLTGWGINFDSNQVVLDPTSALEIGLPTGGKGKHYGYLGLLADNMDTEDVVVSSLNIVNGASFGHFTKADDAELTMTPIIYTDEHVDTVASDTYGVTHDPRLLQRRFESENKSLALAVRVSGKLNSAYKNGAPITLEEGQALVKSTEKANIILVGDSDLLADNFWVQKSNFFGQTILNPFANNGDFLANAIENLGGSSDLIGVRARGKFSRPFDVVQDLTVAAETKFREKEQELQQRLEQTEQKLKELNSQNNESTGLTLSKEQREALESFQQEKLQIRKELREVRHQLDKDIDALGSVLKFINIALMPLLLTFLLALISRRFRRTKLAQA